MANFTNWFNTFIEEKDLPYVQWELTDSEGRVHLIDTDVVKEAILNCNDAEQAQLKDMLVKIDFGNGDVNDYFKHLAQALVNNY